MSRSHNTQLGGQNDEIPLIPYQVADFLDQEQLLSDLSAQVSARLTVDPGRAGDLSRDSTLASAWYRMHPEDIDDVIRSSDKSSDESSEPPRLRQRSSARRRPTRIPSTATPSSSSKASSSRPSPSKGKQRKDNSNSPFISNGYWSRKRLQAQWDRATREAGSASVKIVNEVDGEEVPGVPEDFQYLEHGYHWGKYAPDPNFLIGCDCDGNCTSADIDSCCIKHIDSDPENLLGFWYDKRGLFRLGNTHILIRECNVNCSCDATCRTRVAQKPRKIPLEVFKTQHCGWGVRPTVGVPRGSIIGLYSGILLKRWEADRVQGDRRDYIFDLDHNVFGEEGPIQNQYSVDGYAKGNWGRFINHSCGPNMQVLPAMFDAPEVEKSYLVFIATKDIPEGKELTLDYHPNLGVPTKPKGKKRRRSDTCMCDAKLCRGGRP